MGCTFFGPIERLILFQIDLVNALAGYEFLNSSILFANAGKMCVFISNYLTDPI